MQKEYKDAMEKISLSDSDKERILANVKKAYEESTDHVVSMDTFARKRPRFSARRMGTVAAAAVVLLVGALVIRSNFFAGQDGKMPEDDIILAGNEEEIWEELDSVEDISKETDCRTYTLSNVSKSYKVKKVEVAKKQKHVKITYKNKKQDDKILLEYKEEENASAVIGQFDEEKELTKEKVGESEVTMYGDEECDGMTWQQESCTFAVKMSKACSPEKAKKLVSGTKERTDAAFANKEDELRDKKKISSNAVGWKGNEKESGDKERRDILKKIYDMYGFRVTIEDPARKVAYKIVDDYESFSFVYDELPELEKQRIVGYAGQDGCPSGVLKGYKEEEALTVNGVQVRSYRNKDDECLFYFVKQNIHFTLLIKEWDGEDTESMLSGVLSVIRISLDAGQDETEEEEEGEEDGDSSSDVDSDSEEGETSDEEATLEAYRQAVQDIQYAVAEGSLKKLSSYIRFPLTIKSLDVTVNSAKEFQDLDPSLIFTSTWVDAVVSYDANKIKSNTKSITLGDNTHSLVCRIKNDSVVITELHVDSDEVQSMIEPTATPSAE